MEEKKLNDPAYRALEANAAEEDELPDADSESLQRSGFADKMDIS